MTYTTYRDENGKHYSDSDLQDMYDEELHDMYGLAVIAGMEYDTGRTLRDASPITYRCLFVDWVDSMEFEEVGHETIQEFLSALDE